MNNFSISETIDDTIDFLKLHYEYILPFSLIYFVFLVLFSFLKLDPLAKIIIQLFSMPLSFSFQYYALKYQQINEKKFSYFFEIYNNFFKYIGAKIITGIIILVLLSPMIASMFQLLETYNFNAEKLVEDIQNQTIKLPVNMSITFMVSILLVIFSLPFILFVEYVAIVDQQSIFQSLKTSYFIGSKFYIKIFLLLIVSFLATFAGLFTCGIGFIIILPFIYLLNYFSYIKFRNILFN